MDIESIKRILSANKEKQFVQRILTPEKYPKLDLGNGQYASHLMSWGQVGNKYVVYPTVLPEGKGLKQHDPRGAWEIVKQNGEYIVFDTPEEADLFSRMYKQYWNTGGE